MKVRLPRQQFVDALMAASNLTGGRTTKPIFGCVRISADEEEVRVRATDGEAALSIGVQSLDTDRKGETVVANDRLSAILREMDDIEVLIEASAQEAVVRGEGSEFRIFVHDPADFPPVPELEGKPDLVLDGAGVRRAVALTAFAAARESGRYAINGVLWQKRGKQLTLVSTDGRRLARAVGPVVKADAEDFEAIVPSKALSVFEKVCVPRGESEWQVEVGVKPNQILLRSGPATLTTALVEGHFPDYELVIPTANDKSAVVDRLAFQGAVRKAALLTTEETRAVRLEFNDQRLTIRSRAPEHGEARVDLPVQYDGPKLEIAFNPNFLTDMLRVVDCEQLTLKLSEGGKPAVIRADAVEGFLYVLMPVAL